MIGTHLPIVGGTPTECSTFREVRAPWDGSLVGKVSLPGSAEVEAAIASVSATAREMADVPAWRRARWLEAIAAGLRRREDVLVRTIVAEAGKPVRLARVEVERAMETFSIAAAEVRAARGEVLPLDAAAAGEGRIGITKRFPVGPVAAITPFNFPLNLVAHKVAPAIAAGCSLVLKPADQTPITALLLGGVALEAGLPPGAFDVVPCDVSDATAFVVDDRLRALSFTGSSKLGWELKAKAGTKRVLLELGGNAAAIVHEDADLEHAAARCATAAFAYAGQVCISLQRALVHESVVDGFTERLLAETARLHVGDPSDPNVLVGPVRSDADAERIMAWVNQAESAGAELLAGGTRDGRVISPTVLTTVDSSLPIYAEEVFGPVLVIEPYRDIEQALNRVNRSRFGLQAGIFTRDVGLLMDAWRELEVGALIHDDAPTFRVDHMPYGGVKDSGMGREGVRYAIEEMTEIRLLAVRSCRDSHAL